MNTHSGWAIIAAVSSVLAVGAANAGDDSSRHEAQSLGNAKISLTEAIHIAERKGNGQATSAEYEFKNGNPAVLRGQGAAQ